MDNLMCDGKEKDLADCRFEGWGANDCDATEAAGVVCKHESSDANEPIAIGKPHKRKHRLGKHYKMEVRLTGGRNKNEGQIEVNELKSGTCHAVIFNFERWP